MKSIILNFFLIILCAAGIFSCKAKKRDTEVKFDIHILKGKFLSADSCIDEIHAINRAELSDKCIDKHNNSISLPLDIGADSTAFAFREGDRRDTLVLRHTFEAHDDDKQYSLKLKSIKLGKSTFEKMDVLETNDERNNSDEIESISIYY